MLSEPMDSEVEIPEENALTFDLLPKEDAVIMASPLTPVNCGAEPPLRLEAGAAEVPLIENVRRVPDPVGFSETVVQSPVAQSPMLTTGRLASNSLLGLFL